MGKSLNYRHFYTTLYIANLTCHKENIFMKHLSDTSNFSSSEEQGRKLQVIGHIHTDFPSKFGVPRQSGMIPSSEAYITFVPPFQNTDCFRGIEDYSHLWLIWEFSGNLEKGWSPTVRPPRLGGNQHVGVFATRAPFRPNPLGLSCVRLIKTDVFAKGGPVLYVSGADLMDGTPIFDIKPYLPFTDSHPEASGSFTNTTIEHRLTVQCDETLLAPLPPKKRTALLETLALDPRPSYQNDPTRIYGMAFAGFDVHFTVNDKILTVQDILPES